MPRGGIAVHINAFNFPGWSLLEKFGPAYLAGMPCIGKPATATSYLTESAVRLIQQSGVVPEGALQLVIGGTGDLLHEIAAKQSAFGKRIPHGYFVLAARRAPLREPTRTLRRCVRPKCCHVWPSSLARSCHLWQFIAAGGKVA